MALSDTTVFDLNERHRSILVSLDLEGRVDVAGLARTLEVSDVTIRKDLQRLEELSLLKRVHGGAVLAHRSKYNLSIGDKLGRGSVRKIAIAKRAMELVQDGDTLILDAGSTVLALARLLPGRAKGLTIVTNSLPVIAELSNTPGFDLIALGGSVRQHSLATIGPLTVGSLQRLHADRAFLGATGATIARGLSTPNIVEAETKAAMIAAASERVALVDGSKIGNASLAPFASWDDLEWLVSEHLPSDFARHLDDRGVRVLDADTANS